MYSVSIEFTCTFPTTAKTMSSLLLYLKMGFFIDFFVLLQMMKHVQLSPYRSRADTVSLSSTTSYGSLSPEPLGSRSSSYSSLNEGSIQVNSTFCKLSFLLHNYTRENFMIFFPVELGCLVRPGKGLKSATNYHPTSKVNTTTLTSLVCFN